MDKALNSLAAVLVPYGAQRDVPLAAHTSFRIGGPAQLFFEPQNRKQLFFAVQNAREAGTSITLMGNGTNLLVSDAGVDGLVIRLGPAFSELTLEDDGTISALAGTLLCALANFAADKGLMGLEWAAGIPGSVGGAVAMNAGAYGGEIHSVLYEVEYLDVTSGAVVCRRPEKGELAYRQSAFTWPERAVISASFRLSPEDGGMQARMRNFSDRRKEKQPLSYPSAGSTFKRPQGHYAGALIEAAGLKGVRIGGAQVSELHAGFVINVGNATCADVRALIELIQKRVLSESGVLLEPEIKFIGRE
ncbi:MAG: UDP-N-acetylmuramate dehydrogenase [Candidatus Pelethousia sp.]|nr:UDP-N-acetylmuramate dehydrogenase [Candidatus Pelethousia sp.]